MLAQKKRPADKVIKAPTPQEVEENLKKANLPKELSAKYHPFYQGKIAAAKFFAANVLPGVTGARKLAAGVDLDVMELDEAAF